MSTRATVLKYVRLSHLYIGVFIAPAVIFFAVTGAVQTFNLHKTGERKGYTPPRILAVLARIHKDATPILASEDAAAFDAAKKKRAAAKVAARVKKSARPEGTAAAALPPTTASAITDPPPQSPAADDDAVSTAGSRHVTLPLKLFFLLVAINLVASTGTGIYMAYKYKSNKLIVGLCLAAGVVLPVVFTIY
jgi:hypothetical protein